MWNVIAEEDMDCTECRHKIRAGSKCLSQMPGDMPDGFRRRKYENYCIACTDGSVARGLNRYVWTLGLALAGLAVSAITVGIWLI